MLAAGITLEELRVENVILRIQANPAEPHGAVADFVLVRTRQEQEVSREQWTATMQFVFMPVIPADLVIFNPMGIQVTYLETDRALINRNSMIAHLREREKNLEPFGWSQEDTEWVAMVCLHSGVFTRVQYSDYFNTHPVRAHRFVQGLVDLRLAVDEPFPSFAAGTARASAGSPTRASTGAGGSQHPAQKKRRPVRLSPAAPVARLRDRPLGPRMAPDRG